MRRDLLVIVVLICGAAFGCRAKESMQPEKKQTEGVTQKQASKTPAPAAEKKPAAAASEPDYIKVQHCLIGFKGSVPGKPITRSKEEAEKLAKDLFERAKKGEDFDAIVKQFTDDSPPGIYGMSNLGKPQKANYYPRNRMVAAFGDTGFPLQVGEFGLAPHDPAKSPFGWHIVKRVE